MQEDRKTTEPEVMDPRRFLNHIVLVHEARKRLAEIIDRKEHWIFAMTGDCGSIALQLDEIHQQRCGSPIEMTVCCCVKNAPAFLFFPRESLAYYEIHEILDVEVARNKAEAEEMNYFVLSMQDPKTLGDALKVWRNQDHLLS